MTYQGRVEKGVVVLEPGARLREGTCVRVEPVAEDESGASKPRSLKEISDMAIDTDLPRDFSTQHAHYTKGFPRKTKRVGLG